MKLISKLMLPLIFAIASVAAFAADNFVDKVYDEVKDLEGVTLVNVTPAMLKSFVNMGANDQKSKEFRDIANEIKGVKVLTINLIESGWGKDKIDKLKSEIKSTYSDYEVLMEVNQKNETVKMLSDKVKKDFIMYVIQKDEVVLINISGLSDLGKLIQAAGMMTGGMPELMEKMEKSKKKAKAGE